MGEGLAEALDWFRGWPLLVRAVLLIGVMAICCIGPGMTIVRRMRLGPMEKLIAAIGLSLVIIYLAAFAIFVLKASAGWYLAATAGCAGLFVFNYGEVRRLVGHRTVRLSMMGMAGLGVWSLLILLLIRNYAGGSGYGDWLEHYERARFYMGDLPHDFRFLGRYLLPARPPLHNAVMANFLGVFGEHFALYQLAATFLNLLTFLAAVALARRFGRGRRSYFRWLPLLFMFTPVIQDNIVFPATKFLTAFYVVSAIVIYLNAISRGDHARMMLAFVLMAAGSMVHMSAGPYIVFMALHYLFVVQMRRQRVGEVMQIAGVCVMVLLPWFAFTIWSYGWSATFMNPSNIGPEQRSFVSLLLYNAWTTIVPHPLRGVPVVTDSAVPLAYIGDHFLTIYHLNAIFAMGCVGGPIVLMMLARAYWRGWRTKDAEMRFWMWFVPVCFVIGIAVMRTPMPLGAGVVCLQSLWIAGLCWLAGNIGRMGWTSRRALLIGMGVDFIFGILLRFVLLSRIPTGVLDSSGNRRLVPGHEGMNVYVLMNWVVKTKSDLTFIGDLAAGLKPVVIAAIIGLAVAAPLALLLDRGRKQRLDAGGVVRPAR